MRRWWAWGLLAPSFIFLLLTFVLPVALMLLRGVSDPTLREVWPESTAALEAWNGERLPPDSTARIVARDIAASHRNGTISRVANRLNYDQPGSRGLLYETAARLPDASSINGISDMARVDPRWGDFEIWTALRNATGPATSFYLLAALDRRLGADGRVYTVPPEQRVFTDIFLRTFKISLVVSLLCGLLGYPVAYLLAHMPPGRANLLMILVLLPFWTSALVRTTAWVVLLQTNGILNTALLGAGLIDQPLELIYNRLGVYIAMTHVLLPFLILPLYGVMKGIDPATVRAAASLGASPFRAFLRVYLPQTLPGIGAGLLIVFTLALGYYLTPALVGGGGDQMISASIAFYTNQSLNWGMAAALSLLLLIPLVVLALAGRTLPRTGVRI